MKDFPMVCVGGLVGGLHAYIRLLQHLSPDRGGGGYRQPHHHCGEPWHEVLLRFAGMPVVRITDGQPVLCQKYKQIGL